MLMAIRPQLKKIAMALLLAWSTGGHLLAQQQPPAPPQPPAHGGVLHVSTEIVLVNVVARDKHGNLIRDLKKEDFMRTAKSRTWPASISRKSTKW